MLKENDFIDTIIELAKAAAQKPYDEDPEISDFSWISGEEIEEFSLEQCYIKVDAVVSVSERHWHEQSEVWLYEEEEIQERHFGIQLCLDSESGWFVEYVDES